MTIQKEATFFGKYCLNQTLRDYHEAFDTSLYSRAASIRGDISPWYARLSRQSVAAVHNLLPDARLILILRNPIERAWSHALMEFARMQWPLRDVPERAFLRRFERSRFTGDASYERIIDRWTSFYDRSALHIDIYDHLCADPADFLNGVLAHIGADTDWAPANTNLAKKCWSSSHTTRGQSDHLPMPEMVRWYLAMQWRDSVCQLNERLEGRVDSWVTQIDQIAGRKAPITWGMKRWLNRSLVVWPERVAYAIYNAAREQRLAFSYDRLRQEAHKDTRHSKRPTYISTRTPVQHRRGKGHLLENVRPAVAGIISVVMGLMMMLWMAHSHLFA